MSQNCYTGTNIEQIEDECGNNFLSTSCVQSPNAITYLDLEAGSNQTQINAAIVAALTYKDQQIAEIPVPDGSETFIEAGDNVEIEGAGTEADPYVVTAIDMRPYKVYTALLTQSDTTAPVELEVSENTIGNIVWTYNGVGYYRGTLSGAFINKTVLFINNNVWSHTTFSKNNSNIIEINTTASAADLTQSDGKLYAYVEVRVYN